MLSRRRPDDSSLISASFLQGARHHQSRAGCHAADRERPRYVVELSIDRFWFCATLERVRSARAAYFRSLIVGLSYPASHSIKFNGLRSSGYPGFERLDSDIRLVACWPLRAVISVPKAEAA
jgi:hypothetical protein